MEDMECLAGGGGSGGGSINLFYQSHIAKGIIQNNGGSGGGTSYYHGHLHSAGRPGGTGGAGSITIGNISTGTFVKDE